MAKRRGDNAQMVIFELTERKAKEIKKAKTAKAVKSEPKALDGHTVDADIVDSQEKKAEKPTAGTERHDVNKKPAKKFLGGIRNIFKKERDSL
jgi:hypothetical protein